MPSSGSRDVGSMALSRKGMPRALDLLSAMVFLQCSANVRRKHGAEIEAGRDR